LRRTDRSFVELVDEREVERREGDEDLERAERVVLESRARVNTTVRTGISSCSDQRAVVMTKGATACRTPKA